MPVKLYDLSIRNQHHSDLSLVHHFCRQFLIKLGFPWFIVTLECDMLQQTVVRLGHQGSLCSSSSTSRSSSSPFRLRLLVLLESGSLGPSRSSSPSHSSSRHSRCLTSCFTSLSGYTSPFRLTAPPCFTTFQITKCRCIPITTQCTPESLQRLILLHTDSCKTSHSTSVRQNNLAGQTHFFLSTLLYEGWP